MSPIYWGVASNFEHRTSNFEYPRTFEPLTSNLEYWGLSPYERLSVVFNSRDKCRGDLWSPEKEGITVRVTSSMLINNFLRNLNNNLSRLERTQNRLSTGKRISRPSDDPAGLAYSMGLRANLAALERYQKNVDTAKTWLEAIDSALDSATNILHRAKVCHLRGQRHRGRAVPEALAKEVGQLLEEMRQ